MCSICKTRHHLECTNVSIKRFYNTMRPSHKENWKCQKCSKDTLAGTSNQNSSLASTSVESNNINKSHTETNSPKNISFREENITIRSKTVINIPTENSYDPLPDEEDINSFDSNLLIRSCPDLTKCTYEDVEELKVQVTLLQTRLESAEQAVEDLMGENY